MMHIAIIMDGNGRWATAQNLPRNKGHEAGYFTVDRITEACAEIGVNYLTLYAFSTENWKRPDTEVDALMNLLAMAIEQQTSKLMKNNIRLLSIGDISALHDNVRESLKRCIEKTAQNTGLSLVLALNYGSKDEMKRAMKKIAADVANNLYTVDQITEKIISNNLDTKDIPNPDILIRTSGECRLSNFLLWQLAYTEMFFTDTLWPDFTKEELLSIIDKYQQRNRRFGGT